MSSWQKRLKYEVLLKSGEHILINGYTGTGKTNFMKWLVQAFISFRTNEKLNLSPEKYETIVWFDRGKSSEINRLLLLFPCKLLIPKDCDMGLKLDFENNSLDIEKVYFERPEDIWQMLDRDRINIVCLQRFLIDPEETPIVVGKLFKTLILESLNYNIHPKGYSKKTLLPPISVFIDELNNIAPSKGQGSGSRSENEAGAWIQQNIEQLRSQGIRIIGSTHSWKKLRMGVRVSFSTLIILMGSNFPSSDKPKLSRFNPLFEKLELGQAIIAFRRDIMSDPIRIPWLGDGEDLGYVTYKGRMKKVKETKEKAVGTFELAGALIQAMKTQLEEQKQEG